MAMDRGGVLFIEYSIHTQDGAVTTATGGWLCDGTSSTDWTSGLWSLFFGDASYEWSVNIVEKFGGISVPSWGDFRDFKSPQGKNFHRRDGTARRPIPEVAPGSVGRSWDKEIFPGTPGRRTRGSRSGIPVPIRSEQRSSYAGNLRGTRSSGRSSGGELRRWDRPSTGSTDLGCTINISKAALCVDITFGNSFAESPCSRFKLPLATCGSEKQATGWRLGECAPVISCSFD